MKTVKEIFEFIDHPSFTVAPDQVSELPRFINYTVHTVNSKIFARTLFSRNFAYAKFCENKTLA